MNLASSNEPIAPLFAKNIIRRNRRSISTRTEHFKTQPRVKNPTRKTPILPGESRAQLEMNPLYLALVAARWSVKNDSNTQKLRGSRFDKICGELRCHTGGSETDKPPSTKSTHELADWPLEAACREWRARADPADEVRGRRERTVTWKVKTRGYPWHTHRYGRTRVRNLGNLRLRLHNATVRTKTREWFKCTGI